MPVSLQVSRHLPSCHQVIFPLTLTLAPVNSVRTEERQQAWEKAEREKGKNRSSVNHKDWVFCLYLMASGEQVCWVWVHSEGWRCTPSTGHCRNYTTARLVSCTDHTYIHTVLYVLLITDRWKNAHFTSIHLIQWLTGIDSIHTWIIELILSMFINHKLGFGFVQLDLGVNI